MFRNMDKVFDEKFESIRSGLPSLSRSCTAKPSTGESVVTAIGELKLVTTIVPLAGLNVGEKYFLLKPKRAVPVLYTVMGAYVAADGTVTVILVAVAAVGVVLTAPNHITLFAAVVLNPEPVIVMQVPGTPLSGENELSTGACALSMVFDKNRDAVNNNSFVFI